MKYIYLITSPSGKKYIGQSKVHPSRKQYWYSLLETKPVPSRKIVNAIRKYTWDKMKFEIIERNDDWSDEELNQREVFWIEQYDSVNTGYNMTKGGDGVDSKCAQSNALIHHKNMTEEKKAQRSKNCSLGQRKRFIETPESNLTRQRKSDAHKGQYQIVSPDGKTWITYKGLKDFAETHKDEINVTYWQLFSAYRKCYTNTVNVKKRKNENNWKVIRLDK